MATSYELPVGSGSKTTGDSGAAISYTRKFKIVKDSPGEIFSIPTLLGLDIGSSFPGVGNENITVVSIEDEPDDESRMSRLVTVTYESPSNSGQASGGGGSGGGGGSSGGSAPSAPNVRPPNVAVDSSFEMIPSNNWIVNPTNLAAQNNIIAFQPSGEIVEGLTRPARSVVFTITQFVDTDPLALSDLVGHVNNATFTLKGEQFPARTLLLKSISSRPVVQEFQGQQYAGWTYSIQIAYRSNKQWVVADESAAHPWVNSEQEIGWDMAVPLRGLNVLNDAHLTGGVFTYPIDPTAWNLYNTEQGGLKLSAQGVGPVPIPVAGATMSAWWAGTRFPTPGSDAGPITSNTCYQQYGRAQVVRQTSTGMWEQADAAQPVPLNPDGSPRARWNLANNGIFPAEQAILAYRRGIYPHTDFAQLGIR